MLLRRMESKIVCIILGNLALYRQGEMAWVREALPAIAELGAGVLLTPEYRAQDPIPLFPPHPSPPLEECARVDFALQEIGEIATRYELSVFLEPLTEQMGRFWRDIDTALSVCQQINHPNVGLVADFNIMNVTEASIPESIRRAGRWIHHVHLADNNRKLPGQGHIDFAAGIHALKEVGYSGWFSFECSVLGNFTEKVQSTLRMLRKMAGETE